MKNSNLNYHGSENTTSEEPNTLTSTMSDSITISDPMEVESCSQNTLPYQDTNYSYLYNIVAGDNVMELKRLINQGLDVNRIDERSNSYPIFIAVNNSSSESLKLLMEHGANISRRNIDQDTILYVAVQSKDIDISLLLLEGVASNENGAKIKSDPNSRNSLGKTPLHCAAENDDKEMIQILLLKGAQANLTDNNNLSPFHVLVKNGFLENARFLLENTDSIMPKALVNQRNDSLCFPLHTAISNEDIKMVQLLISYGAEIDIANISKETPIHLSIKNGNIIIFNELIKERVQISAKDKDIYGNNLVFSSARANNLDMLKFLLNQEGMGSLINDPNNSETCALHAAANNCNYEMVQYLLEQAADPNLMNKNERTPLGICVRHKSLQKTTEQYKILKLLIDNEATIIEENLEDALHSCPKNIIELLLDNSPNNIEKSKLLYKLLLDIEIDKIEILVDKGADVNYIDQFNDRTILKAIESAEIEKAKFLLEKGAIITDLIDQFHKIDDDQKIDLLINAFIADSIIYNINNKDVQIDIKTAQKVDEDFIFNRFVALLENIDIELLYEPDPSDDNNTSLYKYCSQSLQDKIIVHIKSLINNTEDEMDYSSHESLGYDISSEDEMDCSEGVYEEQNISYFTYDDVKHLCSAEEAIQQFDDF